MREVAVAILKTYLVTCIAFMGSRSPIALLCHSDLCCRVVGSAAFRKRFLERYDTVVAVPYNPDISTAKSMAGDIKAAVEARTGLPLDSFCS